MPRLLFVFMALLLAGPSWGATEIEKLTAVFMGRGCGGCHRDATARLSPGNFTIESEHELLKSFAYRHYLMRERVMKAFGQKLMEANYPSLKAPSIHPAKNTLRRFMDSLTIHEEFNPAQRAVIAQWFAEGAPLPAIVHEEVFREISELLSVFSARDPSLQ